ncbi:MAG: hypothetical protein RBT49_06900 [Bacteroidales bacterium]|jgi:hypothetical protein|nr:hypothetical protein [Bacteroidales bacterium]
MELKKILGKIHEEQLETFSTISEFRQRKHTKILPIKHRGLYWIWAKLSYAELKEIKNKPNSKEVPIAKLVDLRFNLKNICNIFNGDYKIIYNGIGGYNKTPASFGLRERINQELNCNDYRTGTLNLLNRNVHHEVNNWAISFFDFDDENNYDIINCFNTQEPYIDYANIIETNWRIEYGFPILNRY